VDDAVVTSLSLLLTVGDAGEEVRSVFENTVLWGGVDLEELGAEELTPGVPEDL